MPRAPVLSSIIFKTASKNDEDAGYALLFIFDAMCFCKGARLDIKNETGRRF